MEIDLQEIAWLIMRSTGFLKDGKGNIRLLNVNFIEKYANKSNEVLLAE